MGKVQGVVLHATHGRSASQAGEFQATLNWFKTPASQVSAHIVIHPDGTVGYVVQAGIVAWHAGAYNAQWLGIEFCKRAPGYGDVITEAQYKSAAWWITTQAGIFGFSPASLVQHWEIQADKIDINKNEPGAFRLQRLLDWIGEFA